jgi:2-isopropylmalate synthase
MINYTVEDATRELHIARSLDNYTPPFTVIDSYRLIDNGHEPEATVQVMTGEKLIHEAATGNGPVDALASVLRKALAPLFPSISAVRLIDYQAHILDAKRGTSTEVEVSITFSDGVRIWKVYALSENINAASFNVLVDGFEYAILTEAGEETS